MARPPPAGGRCSDSRLHRATTTWPRSGQARFQSKLLLGQYLGHGGPGVMRDHANGAHCADRPPKLASACMLAKGG
jgi:hypothetical protein